MAGAREVGALWKIKLRSGWTPVFAGGYYRTSGEHLLVFGSCDDRLSMRRGVLLAGKATINRSTHKARRLQNARSSADVWPYSDDIFPQRQATDNILGKAVKVDKDDGLFMGIVLGRLDAEWTIGFLDGSQVSGQFASEYGEFVLADGTRLPLQWVDLEVGQLAPIPQAGEDDGGAESSGQEDSEEVWDGVATSDSEPPGDMNEDDAIEVIDLMESDDSDAQVRTEGDGARGGVEEMGVEVIVIDCDEMQALPSKKRPREPTVVPPNLFSKVAKVGTREAKRTQFRYHELEEGKAGFQDAMTSGAHVPQEGSQRKWGSGMDIDVGTYGKDSPRLTVQTPDSPKQKVTPLFAKFFKEREVVEHEKEPSLGEGEANENVTIVGNSKAMVVNGSGPAEHETVGDDRTGGVMEINFAADLHLRCFEASLAVPGRSNAKIQKATSYAISGAEFGVAGKVVQLIIGKMESAGDVETKIDMLYLVESILHSSDKVVHPKNEYMAWIGMKLSRIVRAMMADSLGSVKLEKILKIWEQRAALSEDVLKSARELMKSLEPCGGSGLTSN